MTVQSAVIKVAVPANAAPGNVIVAVNGRASNVVNFVIHGAAPNLAGGGSQ